MQLVFPPNLTPKQRAILHEVGETFGIHHASAGDGTNRHITLGAASGERVSGM